MALVPLSSCDSNETILGPLNNGGGDRTQVVPSTTETFAGRDQADFVGRIAAANRDVVAARVRIIREGDIRVTYVPGNHDLDITAGNIARILPGIHQARDDVQGLGTYSPEGQPAIAIEHGHRYNFFCAPDPLSNGSIAPGSILPPGYFLTRIAALHVVQQCATPGDSIRTVTPNTGGGASQALAYANSGAWIDHSPGRTTLNVVVITPQGPEAWSRTAVKVYEFTGETVTELAADSARI